MGYMNEGAQRIPELQQYWKPKRKPQTIEDIDKAAQFHKELTEDIERYFEKQARQQQENPKETLFGLFLALLGTFLTSGAEYVSGGKEKS
jgi:hypothetical protein